MPLRGKPPSPELVQPYPLNRTCRQELPTLPERTNQVRPFGLLLHIKTPAPQRALCVPLAIIRLLIVATGAPLVPRLRKHALKFGKPIPTANEMAIAICIKPSLQVQYCFSTFIDSTGLLYGLDLLIQGQG